MAVIGFTQDPQAPEGAGMFHLDDGRSIFAHDPDMARTLTSEQREARYGPDMRFAGPGAPPPDPTADLHFDPGWPNSGRSEYDARKAAEAEAAKPKVVGPVAAPPDVMQPPDANAGGGDSERDRNFKKYAEAQLKQMGKPHKEAFIPKTKAETVETEGVPYNPEDAAIRIHANEQVVQARAATAEMLRQRAADEIAVSKARQPELLHRAAEAQKQLDAQHAAYQRERSDLDRAIEQSNASQGGASQWFASKGTMASAAMILGQAFGAYAATLSGGENWAQKQINTLMEHDIAAQKEQAKRGVDNAYRRLELRYKDSDQAEAALRLAQGNALANLQAMHASANQAQDVQAAHQEWMAQNQAAMVANEQKFQNAAYGKHTAKVELTHQAASAGGAPDLVALAKKLKAIGFPEEEITRRLFGANASQGDAIDRKNVATINGQPYEFDREKDATEATEKIPKLDKIARDGEEIKRIIGKPGVLNAADRARVQALKNEMSLGFGPAFSGSTRINETEIHQGQSVIGDPDAFLQSDIMGRNAAAIDTVIEQAKAERTGIMQGGVRVSRKTGVNEKGQRERKYKYETAPTTLEDVE